MSSKASKESVINALHRKANKNELDAVLKNKVDVEEIQNFIVSLNNKVEINDLEKFQSLLDNKADKSEISNINNSLNNKVELKDFELLNSLFKEFKKENSKKIDELDLDLDRLIENVKKEFGTLNLVLNNLEMKKVEYKDIDNLNVLLSKKCDIENLNIGLNSLKKDFYESISQNKLEFQQNKKKLEEQINEKLDFIELNLQKVFDDQGKNKEKINNLVENQKIEQEDLIKLLKTIINNTHKDLMCDINILKTDLQKCFSDNQEIISRKLDKKDFENLKSKLINSIEHKVNRYNLFYFSSWK